MKNIAKALLEAQKEMGNAIKDSSNPFFKSKYADLNAIREACMPSLNKHGIVVLQPIVHIEGKNFVKTVLLHESGETFEGLTEIVYSKTNDAQAQGSGITYARRYGLQSIINVGAEDDDGNSASLPPTNVIKLEAETKLKACQTLEALQNVYMGLTVEQRKLTLNLKEELKAKLNGTGKN